MLIGTFCSVSERFVAVTITSVESLDVAVD